MNVYQLAAVALAALPATFRGGPAAAPGRAGPGKTLTDLRNAAGQADPRQTPRGHLTESAVPRGSAPELRHVMRMLEAAPQAWGAPARTLPSRTDVAPAGRSALAHVNP